MDGQVLQRLYEAYGRELFLYLYSLCKSRETAEDLMQETFVRALLSLPDEHVNVRAWLYMVARNLYYSTYRKRKHEVSFEGAEAQSIARNEMESGGANGKRNGQRIRSGDGAGGVWPYAAPERELLDRLIRKEEEQMLYAALSKLDSVKREVLELQYFSEMPLRQVAQILGMKPENVRVLSHRAKREVKKYMEEAGYGIS